VKAVSEDQEQVNRSLEAEAAVHLIRAGRELLSAAKAVIEGLDAYLEVLEQRVGTSQKPVAPIEVIPIRRERQS
jgi:hypothetical protein